MDISLCEESLLLKFSYNYKLLKKLVDTTFDHVPELVNFTVLESIKLFHKDPVPDFSLTDLFLKIKTIDNLKLFTFVTNKMSMSWSFDGGLVTNVALKHVKAFNLTINLKDEFIIQNITHFHERILVEDMTSLFGELIDETRLVIEELDSDEEEIYDQDLVILVPDDVEM